MDPNPNRLRQSRDKASSSSSGRLKRSQTSSKHEISFLLNGPKPSPEPTFRYEDIRPPPPSSEPVRNVTTWKDQQLWARNEIKDLKHPLDAHYAAISHIPSLSSALAKRTCAHCGKTFAQSADLKKQYVANNMALARQLCFAMNCLSSHRRYQFYLRN